MFPVCGIFLCMFVYLTLTLSRMRFGMPNLSSSVGIILALEIKYYEKRRNYPESAMRKKSFENGLKVSTCIRFCGLLCFGRKLSREVHSTSSKFSLKKNFKIKEKNFRIFY